MLDGFTLVELLVVISIIAILAGLLLPAVRVVKEKSLGLKCASNIRQLGFGIAAYAEDNEGILPNTYNSLGSPVYRWTELIATYVEASKKDNGTLSTSLQLTNSVLAGCPSYKPTTGLTAWDVGYGLNGQMNWPTNGNNSDTRNIATGTYKVFSLASVSFPSNRCLLVDCPSFSAQSLALNMAGGIRHQNRLTTLFVDLHVQPLLIEDYLLTVTNPAAYSP